MKYITGFNLHTYHLWGSAFSGLLDPTSIPIFERDRR